MSTFRGGASDTLVPDALDPVARRMPPAPRGAADIRVLRVPIPTRWSLIHSAARLANAASVGISNKKLLRTASKQIIGSSAAALPFASHGVMKMLTLMVIPIVYDDYYDGISLSFQFQIQVCSSVVLGNLIKYTHYTEVFKTSSASPL